MNELDMFNQQVDAQKDLARLQGEEQVKPYLPTMAQQMSEAQAVVIEQLNPKKIVKDILLELAGLEEDENGGGTRKIGDRLVNGYGLSMMRTLMRGVINQNTIFTDLREKEIKNLMIRLSDDLCLNVGLNWREYGIKSRTDCDSVMNIILFNTYAALKRAQNANEKRFHKSIAFESIGGQQNKQKQKEGGLSGFFGKIKL